MLVETGRKPKEVFSTLFYLSKCAFPSLSSSHGSPPTISLPSDERADILRHHALSKGNCAVPALRLAFAYLKHGFLHSAMVAGWGGGEEGEENKLYSACTLSLFPLC